MKALRLSRETVLLLGILALAFLVRVFAVNFGLPELYHADEPIVVNHALAYGTGDLNPHFFKIPPLVSYLLFFCYGIFYVLGRTAGYFHSVRDLEQLFYSDPTSFYLIARVIFGVLLGTATVYGVYRLVKRLWTTEMALWAALLLAVNFLHARDSHYIYADIPLLCVLLTGFCLMARLSDAPSSWKLHLLCGGTIGLAAATKYNGVFLALPYLWVCLRTVPWRRWPVFWGFAGATAGLVFILCNPFSVLDWPLLFREVTDQSRSNQGVPWFHHIKYSLSGAVGASLLTVAFGGWLRAVFSGKPAREAMAIFVLGYYMVLCRWGQPYDRYVLPLVPFVCIFAVDFLIPYMDVLSKGKVFLGVILKGIIILILVIPAFWKIVQWDRLMASPDVRTVARAWIESHIPPGSRIALEGTIFTPRLSFSSDQLKEKMGGLDRTDGAQAGAQKRRLEALLSRSRQPSYELYFLSRDPSGPQFLFAEPKVPFDLETLRRKKVDYVVMVSEPRDPKDPFAAGLEKVADPVVKFSPYRKSFGMKDYDTLPLTGGPFLWKDIRARERNGYTITVYKLK